MSKPPSCRCCERWPLVGWFGLCKDCDDAVKRFLASRREGFKRRGIVK